jgi:hypothetical protein
VSRFHVLAAARIKGPSRQVQGIRAGNANYAGEVPTL